MAKTSKVLQMRVSDDLEGWLSWHGEIKGSSQASYIESLMRADRDSADAETMKKYKVWLYSTGRDEELREIDPNFSI